MIMGNVAFCSPFVPEEWIAAHGLQPQRMRTLPGTAQSPIAAVRGVCPYAGAMVEKIDQMLTDRPLPDSPDLRGLVLTTICDQMRYSTAFIRENLKLPTFLMNVPSTWQTPAAKRLYRDELQRLGRFLVGLGGITPSTDGLVATMRRYDAARCTDRTIRSGENGRDQSWNTPLALVGGPLSADGGDDIFAFVSRAGGRIVLDASEHGERTLPAPFDNIRLAEDPLSELVEAYYGTIPDVFRRPNTRLYEWLGKRLAERKVRGILFCRYVFCDLWHAELQRMREWSPVPILDIDITHDDDSQPARTIGRIEAFLEMLK